MKCIFPSSIGVFLPREVLLVITGCYLPNRNVFSSSQSWQCEQVLPKPDKQMVVFSIPGMNKTVAMTAGVRMPALTHHSLSRWSLWAWRSSSSPRPLLTPRTQRAESSPCPRAWGSALTVTAARWVSMTLAAWNASTSARWTARA